MNTIPQDLSNDIYAYILLVTRAKCVVLLLIYYVVQIVFSKDVQRCYLTN